MKGYTGTRLRDPARERLIAEHIDLARRIALRVGRKVPAWLSQDDLVAAAMIGLAEAADRFDDARGEPFIAFAERRIRGAVLDELRRGDLMPRRVRSIARRVGTTIRELEHRFGRPPEDEEIASALGVSVEEYREELEMLPHVRLVEFDPDQDRSAAMAAGGALPDSVAERDQLVARLRSCLERLEKRDALVLSLYYVEEFAYNEIAEVLGVSESRVCQLHARALTRLRAEFDAPPEEVGHG